MGLLAAAEAPIPLLGGLNVIQAGVLGVLGYIGFKVATGVFNTVTGNN